MSTGEKTSKRVSQRFPFCLLCSAADPWQHTHSMAQKQGWEQKKSSSVCGVFSQTTHGWGQGWKLCQHPLSSPLGLCSQKHSAVMAAHGLPHPTPSSTGVMFGSSAFSCHIDCLHFVKSKIRFQLFIVQLWEINPNRLHCEYIQCSCNINEQQDQKFSDFFENLLVSEANGSNLLLGPLSRDAHFVLDMTFHQENQQNWCCCFPYTEMCQWCLRRQ